MVLCSMIIVTDHSSLCLTAAQRVLMVDGQRLTFDSEEAETVRVLFPSRYVLDPKMPLILGSQGDEG